MRQFLFFIICTFSIITLDTPVVAQNSTGTCGWQAAREMAKKADPVLFNLRKMASEKKLQQYLQHNRLQDTDSLYTIPLVVHVIHTGTPVGSPDNPSDADITDMITGLNDAWRKNGPSYGGVDMKMQFQLAVRSPQCGTTTGIIRVNGSSVPNYVSGGIAIGTYPGSADEWTVKALSRWPNTDYINIWIVNKINGSSTGTGGFAYFAEYNSAAGDGIVINSLYANGASSKTLAHEMGHVFEMYHTFYDDAFETTCPRTDSCAFYGDRVCDTEGGLVEYVCTNTINSCTGLPYLIEDATHNYTVLNNYMNYTDCAWMFTQGQKDRIRATLFLFRQGLISSGALSPPPASSPATACVPTADNGLSPYYGVEKLEFNDLSVYSNSSLADSLMYIDRSCNQRTTVRRGQTYPLTITGSYLNPCWIKAFIDYNNDGDFDDAGETLVSTFTFDGFVTTNITIPSSGVVITVPLRLRIIADDPSFEPTACHLTGVPASGAGQAEDYGVIISSDPPLPVTWLYFRGKTIAKDNILEWATANEQNSKQFDVERSLNGTDFYRTGIVNAAGTSDHTNTYQYTDHDIDRLNSEFMFYRLKQIDIDGNYKYSSIVPLRYAEKKTVNWIVYPNPTQGSITLITGDHTLAGSTAILYDMNGRLMEKFKLTANSQQVNLAKYMAGIYFIRLNNGEVLKIVKQ